MAILCLRRLLALFLLFVAATALPQDAASPTTAAASDSPTDPASLASSNSRTSYSVRATTMYVISESFTYDPTTFSTTTILETIFPTTRTTHALDSDVNWDTAAGSATFTPSSPFAAAATLQQSSSAQTVLVGSGGLAGVVAAVFALLL